MLYLDHAATSATRPEVIESLSRDLARPLNASSVHQPGQRAQALLEEARGEIAALLGLQAREVIFTASATESNNLAIRGFTRSFHQRHDRPPTVLTSVLEHACIRETCRELTKTAMITAQWAPIDEEGRVCLDQVESDVDLITLPAVQNETGVMQDLDRARKIRLGKNARWLCDMTQGVAVLDLDLREMGADWVSFASHKIGGPPGIAVLAGPGLPDLMPMITGGPQEGELRAGTQPVALARGLALAMRLAVQEREETARHLRRLEEAFIGRLQEHGIRFSRNGAPGEVAPGFINVSLHGLSGPDLVIALDGRGIAVSSGSACATGVMETSEALAAMFPDDPARAAGALRLTPWRETTVEEMILVADTLAEISTR